MDLASDEVTERQVLAGAGLTALTFLATGELLVAGSGGEVVVVPGFDRTPAPPATAAAHAAAFLAATTVVPNGFDEWSDLLLTNGRDEWTGDDLDGVTHATTADPMWAQLRASVNQAFADCEPPQP